MGTENTPKRSAQSDKKALTKDEKQWFAIAGLLLLLAIFCGLLAAFGKNGETSSDSAWGTYKNSKLGIKFDYLKAWGTPVLAATPASVGTNYSLNFTNTSKLSVIAAFSSEDMKSPGCSDTCSLTDAQVQKQLQQQKTNYIKSDSTSYTYYYSDKATGINGRLSMNQIVSLPAIKVSAISIDYTEAGSDTCPTASLAANGNASCVTEADYQNLDKFAKSIQHP